MCVFLTRALNAGMRLKYSRYRPEVLDLLARSSIVRMSVHSSMKPKGSPNIMTPSTSNASQSTRSESTNGSRHPHIDDALDLRLQSFHIGHAVCVGQGATRSNMRDVMLLGKTAIRSLVQGGVVEV